jgi:hypothetical protein
MKFADIMKRVANVGTGIFIGTPIFAEENPSKPILPSNTSNKIIAAIATTELLTSTIPAMKDLQGPDKLAAASAIAKAAILSSSALSGAEIDDQERFDVGVWKITDGWNDVIKSVKKK